MDSDAVNPTPAGAGQGGASGQEGNPGVDQQRVTLPSAYITSVGSPATAAPNSAVGFPPQTQVQAPAAQPQAQPQPQTQVSTVPQMNFYITPSGTISGQNPQTTQGAPNTMTAPASQNASLQPGSGTVPASDAQAGTPQGQTPNQPSNEGNGATGQQKKPEKIQRQGDKLLISQERFNDEIAEAKRKAEEKVRAELEEARQAEIKEAERLKAIENGETVRLYNEERQRATTLEGQLRELTNRLEGQNMVLMQKQTEIQGYVEIMDGSVDAKIAEWPAEIKEMDPKVENPEGYTIAQRLQWVAKMQKLVERLQAPVQQEQPQVIPQPPAQAVANPQTTAVQQILRGNGPTPQPAGNASNDLQQQLEIERQKFRAAHPFAL